MARWQSPVVHNNMYQLYIRLIYSFSRLLKHICPLWHHIFKTVNTQDKTEAQWPKWLILFAKCSNTHKTLKTCNISKYFHQTPQLVVKLIYSFNQSLHDGQQNTAINMKYDTLQTQMDTGKKKLPKETYGWKYSQVHKFWDIDTILTFLALYTTTMDFKWNEQDVL